MLPGTVKYDSLTAVRVVCVCVCVGYECVCLRHAMTRIHPNVLVRLSVNFSLGQTLA